MNENLEAQPTSLEELPAPVKPRRWLWGILGALLVAALAAAAFLGGRYLQKGAITQGSGYGPSLTIGGAGASGAKTFRLGDMIPAEELPKTDPEVRGIFVSRQDNSLYVGTGQVTIMASVDQNGNANSGSSYDGPKVEIVTTATTQIYRDDTLKDMQDLSSSDEQIQQKVVPGSLDEVGQNSAIQAWGKKVGDRVIAEVLVYSQPEVFNARVK